MRATLMRNGEPHATVRRAAGVGRSNRGSLIMALLESLEELESSEAPVFMSGMIGSSVGFQTAPYVRVPAGPADVQRSLTRLDSHDFPDALRRREVWIVPGLDFVDGERWDVMRGEETEFFGQDVTDGTLIAPGSHSKWIIAINGQITRFRTMMSGELFAAVGAHSLLSASVTSDLKIEESGVSEFRAGVNAAQTDGLLSNLFSVRTRSLAGASRSASTAFLSGLIVGAELSEGLRWAGRPDVVTIISDGAMRSWYETALQTIGVAARPASDSAAAKGIWRIAATRSGNGLTE